MFIYKIPVHCVTRDDFTCQYCGVTSSTNELNLDHVLPRSRGGTSTWENIVTSCYACNQRKAGRTPEEARMRLSRRPARPNSLPWRAASVFGDMPELVPEWRAYC